MASYGMNPPSETLVSTDDSKLSSPLKTLASDDQKPQGFEGAASETLVSDGRNMHDAVGTNQENENSVGAEKAYNDGRSDLIAKLEIQKPLLSENGGTNTQSGEKDFSNTQSGEKDFSVWLLQSTLPLHP